MANNIFQQQVVPNKPKVLAEERIYVYMPTGDGNKKGMVSVNQRDFNSPNGYMSLRWPMEMQIQTLANPVARPSYTKVLEDEFVNTNNIVRLVNPITGVAYSSQSAEIKLNRIKRDALARPDLVMLDSGDFEQLGPDANEYYSYKIKRNNPLETATLVQVSNSDFKYENELVKINWPYADKNNGYGLVKISTEGLGSLGYDVDGKLQVDLTKFKKNIGGYLDMRPTYGEVDITKWPDKDLFVDPVTGLAKRDTNGNILFSFTKEAIGLSNIENKTLASRTYDEFGTAMKTYFDNRFNSKLDKSNWDGETGLFRDWTPPTTDKNTVQRWLTRLEEEDSSLRSSIQTLKVFLGFFNTTVELEAAYPATATLFGCNAYNVQTNTYWAVRQGELPETWEWYDTLVQELTVYGLLETDVTQLKPNAPVASVGDSGKLLHSNHAHPSDPNKLDTYVVEDSVITITTLPSNANDFQVKFAETKVLNSLLEPIVASIVNNSQYLNGIQNPVLNDYAITRNNNKIYMYNGTEWIDTNEVGSIVYNTKSFLNIPYVRTSQYLHNWKKSPTMFQQSEDSNEAYWAGTKEEFENLNLGDIPNGTLIHVTDDEDLMPGYFVTEEVLDEAGIGVSTTERFVTIDSNLNLVGLPLTMTEEVTEFGKDRKRISQLQFGDIQLTPDNNHKMAITVLTQDGKRTLAHRSFTPNRFLYSDQNGNIEANDINSANGVFTSTSTSVVNLQPNTLVKATGSNTIASWQSGLVADKPIVSNGADGIKILTLNGNKFVKTNANGGLDTVLWLENNLIKTSNSTEEVNLIGGNKVAITGLDNTISEWVPENGVVGSLVVRGAQPGQIAVRQTGNINRLLMAGDNGTIVEIGAGEAGQYLALSIDKIPTWATGPGVITHLPQTKLTTNPSVTVANGFAGLVAVVLDQAPTDLATLRDNCIYYY